jgi:predicted Ser/Thr protein kinase
VDSETNTGLEPGDPERLGPYRLERRLGSGGMGTVYLAAGVAGQRVAVKAIRGELARQEAFRARFRREAEAARRVARFCTAQVLDADVDGGRPWIATEYIPGRDLEAVVRERGPLTGSSLEALAVGVLTALTAIHAAGVVHRDLKPGNVLLGELGPRVIDFGIAGAVDFATQITGSGQWLGTPAFAAPEQMEGHPIGPAADVWSWGALMVFAATGRLPYDGTSLARLAFQVVYEEPRLDGLDPRLLPLVEQAMRKDPGDRPAAGELLRRLLGEPGPASAGPGILAGHDLVARGSSSARERWATATPPPAETAATETVTGPAPGLAPPAAPSGAPWTAPGGNPTRPPGTPVRAMATLVGVPPPSRLERVVPWAMIGLVLVLVLTGGVLGVPWLAARLERAGEAQARGAGPATTAPPGAAEPGTAPEPEPASVTEPPPTTANRAAPWAGARLAAADVPGITVSEWRASGLGPGCPAAGFTSTGSQVTGARPRRADFSEGQWATAWDKPGLPGSLASGYPCPDCGRSAFGVAGIAEPEDPSTDAGYEVRTRYADGSTAAYGPGTKLDEDDPAEPIEYQATVRLPGNRCQYTIWSYVGQDHLEALIDHLRLVRA